jgi:LPS export ABC transporter protein LptC
MGKKTPLVWIMVCFLWGCSFDYGESMIADEGQPDIVMNDVEYVRVRDGNPIARFEAETAERYENRQAMELENFTFEQFSSGGEEVNAVGSAGHASVELDSGNIHMKDGVRIEVESEDITIATANLDWVDQERSLTGGKSDPVSIQRADGTNFTGWGFSADARRRTWTFDLGVDGTYIHEDDDSETEEADEQDTE